jgi:hypothetical protein
MEINSSSVRGVSIDVGWAISLPAQFFQVEAIPSS